MAQATQGAFVPVTNIFDVAAIYSADIHSPEFRTLLVRLRQDINNIAILLNLKDTGQYAQTEYINGQQYFPDPLLNSTTANKPIWRSVIRLVVDFGQLPNTGTKSVAHGLTITDAWSFTRIYATASDTTGLQYIPIPYVSVPGTDGVELLIDATNVTITTQSNRSNFDMCYVVLEYIKT